MRHYMNYTINIDSNKIAEDCFFVSPSFTVSHQAKKFKASYDSFSNDNLDIESTKKMLMDVMSRKIAEELESSLHLHVEEKTSSGFEDKTFSLRANIVLEDEKKIYEAKEEMLIYIVKDANETIGRLLEKNENLREKLKSYKNMSFFEKLKFIVKG